MKMYRLHGHIVELADGRVVHYANSSVNAKAFCDQNNLPHEYIRPVYVHEEVVYSMDETPNIELYEPDQNGILKEAKKETND